MATHSNQTLLDLRQRLLSWYDREARVLPWRVSPTDRRTGRIPDPYHVWLSEIMLQQTTVVTVAPYFAKFLDHFPTLQDLAKAPLDQVLGLWAGLGYYARARNLHAGAQALAQCDRFPQTSEALEAIPGIGPYTAAAIASIAFDQPIVPVDGNVERVLSRLWHIEDSLPAAKPLFRAAAARLAAPERSGDFAQALMDLGARICTPRTPKCPVCPWSSQCEAARRGTAHTLPRKQVKKAKPTRVGHAFVILTPSGLSVRRRPEQGLLGGMLEVPGSSWIETVSAADPLVVDFPVRDLAWIKADRVSHVFTHFALHLDVWAVSLPTDLEVAGYHSLPLAELDRAALPRVMDKVVKSGLAALARVDPVVAA